MFPVNVMLRLSQDDLNKLVDAEAKFDNEHIATDADRTHLALVVGEIVLRNLPTARITPYHGKGQILN